MTLIGLDVLTKAAKRNQPLDTWLRRWKAVVENSEWRSIADVRVAYPSADGVKLKTGTVATIFNVKGGHYRLIASLDYDAQAVETLELITHAEYDKNLWKARY